MNRRIFWAAFVVVSLACSTILASAASAQGIPPDPPSSAAEIVMPSEIVAGEPATLAVLDSTGHLSQHASVSLSSGIQIETNALGRAEFLAPAMPGPLFARISNNSSVVAVSIVLEHAVPYSKTIDWAPEFISIPDRFEIRGTGFHGDAGGNDVRFRQEPAFVLASSPVSMVILLKGDTAPGAGELTTGEHFTGPPTIIIAMAVELEVDGQGLVAGQKANLQLRVRGTEQAQDLEIENLAPEVLKLPHGKQAFTRTSGGEDNSAHVEVQAIRGGDFSFHVHILQNDGSTANTVAARDFLTAARQLASPSMAKRLDPLVSKLGHLDNDALPVIKQIDKMSGETNNEQIKVLFTAARNSLMGR